jgi:hypothetical protein
MVEIRWIELRDGYMHAFTHTHICVYKTGKKILKDIVNNICSLKQEET